MLPRALVAIIVLSLHTGCAFQTKAPPPADTGTSPEATAPGPDPAAEVVEVAGEGEGLVPEDATPADSPPEVVAPPLVGGPADWVTTEGLRPHSAHVTWVLDPSATVTVQWQTRDAAPAGYVPRVWFAAAPETDGEGDGIRMPMSTDHVVEGETTHYPAMVQDQQVQVAQYHVDLTGLQPDTEYFYRVGTWAGIEAPTGKPTGPELSRILRFKTGPVKGDRKPIRLGLLGDSRADGGKIAEHAPRVAQFLPDVWLFTGDMTQKGVQEEWWYWLDAMHPLLDTRVMMPVQGNHETVAELYYNQWFLPNEDLLDPSLREHAWSFDIGNVHVVGLDSTVGFLALMEEPWLDDDLKAARSDPDIDWIVAVFHHPAYSASTSHGSDTQVGVHFVPYFEKYHVDLAFSGHDHDYERSKPIRENQVVSAADGTVYVVAGAFFAPPYGNGYDWWTETSSHGNKANYVFMEVDGKTFRVTAWSGDGTEKLDEFTLTK